jgi:hypothetical protein
MATLLVQLHGRAAQMGGHLVQGRFEIRAAQGFLCGRWFKSRHR